MAGRPHPTIAVGFGLLLLLAVPHSALAQQYPPSSGELTISTSEPAPGDQVTVSGDGYAPSSDVTITFESVPVVVAVVRTLSSGQFTTEVVVPLDATLGMHMFRASGLDRRGSPRALTATVTVRNVSAAPSLVPGSGVEGSERPPRSGGLARTGSSTIGPAVTAAVALLISGGLFLVQVRRRTQPAGSS